MEVIGERAPPLPPKTKKPNGATFCNGTTISIAPGVVGHEVGKDGDSVPPPQRVEVPVRRVAESESESDESERVSQVAVKSRECDSETRVKWGGDRGTREGSEEVYENVSNGGVKYLEQQLKNIVRKGEEGRRRTPKIEVRQEENKTVVRISVKETETGEEEVREGMYENGCFGSNGFASVKGEVVWGRSDKGEEKVGEEGEGEGMYENVVVERGEEGWYENVEVGEGMYANVSEGRGSLSRGGKKELRSEVDYCGTEGKGVRIVSQKSIREGKSSGNVEDEDASGKAKNDYRIYANENLYRNAEKSDEAAEKDESGKKEKKPSVVEMFLHRPVVKVDKGEAEYVDDNSSGDPFDSGTCSDVDSLPNFVQSKKGNVIVTIKSLGEEKKMEAGHRRAESLTSSGVGVDSEESDDEKSNISCDSLNSNDPYPQSYSEDHGYHTPNSEDKTGSPIDQIEYENVMAVPESDKTDIIQQVANASRKIKNLRMENTATFTAKLVHPADFDEYENVRLFEPPKTYKKKPPPPPPPSKPVAAAQSEDSKKALPKSLLRDIRCRNVRLSATYPSGEKQESVRNSVANAVLTLEAGNIRPSDRKHLMVEEKTYEERKTEVRSVKLTKICAMEVDTDQFYKFHLAENVRDKGGEENGHEEETFAGVKDYLCREKPAAITSAKGTIRGVKNRVKAGIATFLQLQENKSYKDRDAGKVVVYTTTMGIVRETYHKCLKVKQILRTLMVKFEERDVFMSAEAQEEIRERMKCNAILVPQVFVEGQHIGDAETIERLNEMGELRSILKPYKSADACSTCKVCGGYRLLPCSVCKGSKKSIHRNHFTAEFVALKCMNCDQVGLTKCYAC